MVRQPTWRYDEERGGEIAYSPECGGVCEVTPVGALTCQLYGSEHYREHLETVRREANR